MRLGATLGAVVFALVLGSPAPSVAKNRMVVFPAEPEQLPAVRAFDVVVDAVFGYSFKGEIRAPFRELIALMATHPRVAAVDVPSGWDVERGDTQQTGFAPALLVSLTAPKLCAKNFSGMHYLGGRFVPDSMAQKYQLELPPYPGSSQIVRLHE